MFKNNAGEYYPFTIPHLAFAYDALEPYIDAKTVETHYLKHHQSYIKNLNTGLKEHPKFQHISLEKLLVRVERLPNGLKSVIKIHGGGHSNHSFFWSILRPGPSTKPKHALEKLIIKNFISFHEFKLSFGEAILKTFGSGWVCLAVDKKNKSKLKIVSLHNHDSILTLGMHGILICDVWEHSYYLLHQNRRTDYIESFWNVVNWDAVGHLYEEIRKRK